MEPEDEKLDDLLSTKDQDEIAELFRKNRHLRGEPLEIRQKAREIVRKPDADKPRPPLNLPRSAADRE